MSAAATISDLKWHLYAKIGSLMSLPAAMLSVMMNPAAAQDVDPSAPLDVLKKARETAAQSNLNIEDAKSAGNHTLNLALIIFGVIGVALAGGSLFKLYNNVQQGDQARGSNMAYVIGLVIGSIMTILAVVVGVITNFATGSGSN